MNLYDYAIVKKNKDGEWIKVVDSGFCFGHDTVDARFRLGAELGGEYDVERHTFVVRRFQATA